MSLVRLYEVWPAKNTFYCAGRCISGPDHSAFYVTLVLILLPSGIWFGFVGPFVWSTFSPVIIFIGVYLLCFQLLCLVTAGYMDPGIIPRNKRNKELITAYTERVTDPYLQQLPERKDFNIGGTNHTVKYCNTCNVSTHEVMLLAMTIFRPPRASHCSTCDNCVDKFDHHCPWVGNCIGRRNYRFFLGFVYCTWGFCMYMFAVSLSVQIKLASSSGASGIDAAVSAITESPVSMLMVPYSFIIFWSVAGLGGFHCILASKAKTTNEDYKHLQSNPYTLGIAKNWLHVFCSPIRASFIDTTQVVSVTTDPEDKKKLLSSPKQ